MSGSGSVWNSVARAHRIEGSDGSNSSATVSQVRSGSPGKGRVRASSHLRNSSPGGRPGTSHRRKPAGSPFTANLAAWS